LFFQFLFHRRDVARILVVRLSSADGSPGLLDLNQVSVRRLGGRKPMSLDSIIPSQLLVFPLIDAYAAARRVASIMIAPFQHVDNFAAHIDVFPRRLGKLMKRKDL
jgi:hypothetical protein